MLIHNLFCGLGNRKMCLIIRQSSEFGIKSYITLDLPSKLLSNLPNKKVRFIYWKDVPIEIKYASRVINKHVLFILMANDIYASRGLGYTPVYKLEKIHRR